MSEKLFLRGAVGILGRSLSHDMLRGQEGSIGAVLGIGDQNVTDQ